MINKKLYIIKMIKDKMIKKKWKKTILFLLVFILINMNFVLVQASLDLGEYLRGNQNLEGFKDAKVEDKNNAWDESNLIRKEVFTEKIIKDLNKKRLNQNLDAEILRRISSNFLNKFLENVEKEGLDDIGGLSLDYLRESGGSKVLWGLLEDMGIDSEVLLDDTVFKEFRIHQQNLKWKEDYLIGDGDTWLDLSSLPPGVEIIDYKDKKFILYFKDGGKLILEPGSTDEKGQIKFLTKYLDDNGLVVMGGKIIGLPSLRNLKVSENGEVVLTQNGFLLGLNTRIDYGKLVFESRESSGGGVVFGENNLVLTGVDFKLKDYFSAKPKSLAEPFIVNFGRFEQLAKKISFEDRSFVEVRESGLTSVGGTTVFNEGRTVEKPKNYGEISFEFNEQGRLSFVEKNGKKIDLSKVSFIAFGDEEFKKTQTNEERELSEIYLKSGEGVKKILMKSVSKDVTFADVEKMFYSDAYLTENAREIEIQEYFSNFASINGENLDMGGKGEIEVFRDLHSLNGHDCDGFEIKVGEMDLEFNEDGFSVPRNSNKVDNAFEIKEITAFLSNRDKLSSGGIISKNSAGEYEFNADSGRVVAGRSTFLGPLGSSVDISIVVPEDKVESMRAAVENTGSGIDDYVKESFVKNMMGSEFELKIDGYIPVKGVSYSGEKLIEFYESNLKEFLTKAVQEVVIGTGNSKLGVRSFNEKGQEIVNEITDSILISLKNKDINPKDISISIKNDPYVSGGGSELFINLRDEDSVPVELSEDEKEFFNDVLEMAIRIPEHTQGNVERYTTGRFLGRDWSSVERNQKKYGPQKYWPASHIKRLWYQNLGRGGDNWDRMMTEVDEVRFKQFFNRYFKEGGELKESLFEGTSRTHY